ncbi:hypothetical protein PPMP20_29675 [Paraburkholderia phymatum]|uniref:Uncharacterized protein n=1 Tax=Paraburkholderia phymatum (strain DSM 17167 / CIP 108236 / LMG 21445 / STM815) TaxID=391038 RepID=B2JRU7_PARP8|nr:hypothetical protein [Paraburkholderia phymatum]ACC73866.1 hypothetical protein Bphy_4757 [Paraburkholderia phymatum STM815]
MRQTVMGVYDSYADACSAQQSLHEAGIAPADIAIYSMSGETPVQKGPRVYAPGAPGVGHRTPVFDRLEQLFARLFEGGTYPPEAEDYREFIRRGGTIVSADVAEMQVEMARDVMRRAGAADIEERTAAWRNGSDERDLSGKTLHQGSATAQEPSSQRAPLQVEQYDTADDDASLLRDTADATADSARPGAGSKEEPAVTPDDLRSSSRAMPANDDAQRDTASAAGGANMVGGMQQVTTRTEGATYRTSAGQTQQSMSAVPDVDLPRTTAGVTDDLRSREARASDNKQSVPAARQSQGSGLVGDPIMGTPLEEFPYDDEFRKDYDARYANTGSSYDEYRRAYAHGTTLGRDKRYDAQDWQSVEASARDDWESRYPESGWERFKAAVRQGWERVRGH